MKYNYSIERRNALNQRETFQVVNCDSFDEAIKAVEKGVYERELKEKEKEKEKQIKVPPPNPPVNPTVPTNMPSTTAIFTLAADPRPDNQAI